jgi:hypothetical protein
MLLGTLEAVQRKLTNPKFTPEAHIARALFI